MLFLSILIMCMLSGAEVDLFIPSFPELQQVFKLSPFLVEWTLGANFCAYCLGSLCAGNLGDRFGRRPIMLGGCLIFILGSVSCVFASNYWFLIAGRILQGFGIAGPAILAYVLIADIYALKEQARIYGILNGIVTTAMAFAPVLGSYVCLLFNWQANFVLLLAMGLLSLVMGWIWLPRATALQDLGHRVAQVFDAWDVFASLSLKAYRPLVRSKVALAYIGVTGFLCAPYWLFIGMAPVLYMEDLGVPLKHFGYYQGALAGVFSCMSLSSGALMRRFGQRACLWGGIVLCWISVPLIGALAITGCSNPLIITGGLLLLCAGVVFPIHILHPCALEVIVGAKARMTALMLGSRLLLTAFSLALISYYYQGSFARLGFAMCFCLVIGLVGVHWISKNHLKLAD